jgi:WD40 repeat protein
MSTATPIRLAWALLTLLTLGLLLCPPEFSTAADEAKPKDAVQKRVDLYGDPLPPGAIARLGTLRFRHLGGAQRVAWSPDGKALVSISVSDVIQWDIATGKPTRRLDVKPPFPDLKTTGHRVTGVAFSRDGRYLAVGFEGNRVHVWNLRSGKLLGTFGEPETTWALAFGGDGKTLVAAWGSQKMEMVRWWDVEQGKEIRRAKPSVECSNFVALAPGGRMLATTDLGSVLLWDLSKGKEVRRFKAGDEVPVDALVFSPDGRTLATSSVFGSTSLWEVSSGKRMHRLPPPRASDDAAAGAFSEDGRFFAAQTERLCRVWDLRTGKELSRIPLSYHSRCIPAFSADGKLLATFTPYSPVIDLWEVKTGKPVRPRLGHRSRIDTVAFSPDGKCLAAASSAIRLWDVAKATQVRYIGSTEDSVTTLAFSPDGRFIVGGGSLHRDDQVKGPFDFCLWDVATGKEIRRFVGHTNVVTSVAFAPDGRLIASASDDRTLRLWDVATGKEVWKCKEFENFLHAVAFSPDGKILASGGEDVTLRLWDVATAKELLRIMVQRGDRIAKVRCVTFSPDGKYVACGADDEWITLWDVRTGKLHRSFAAPPARFSRFPVTALAFSPDGRTLVSAGEHQVMRLWEVLTGKERHRIGHHGWAVAFSPEARRLASGGEDTTLLIWDVAERARGGRGPATLTPAELRTCWEDLGSEDAMRGFRAIGLLRSSPSRATAFLAQQLRPLAPDRIRRLVADLDSTRFAVREKAFKELAVIGEAAEPALRQAFQGSPSLELRRRVERLLAGLVPPIPPERLRRARALEALESMNTREAKSLLEKLNQTSQQSPRR